MASLVCCVIVNDPPTRPGLRTTDLTDLSSLASFQDGSCHQVSSYDRSGGNADGSGGDVAYARADARGEHVLLEVKGPGAIETMWFTDLRTIGDLRFYFDGEGEPRLSHPAHEYFEGKLFPFVAPLVGDDHASSGGFYSNLPMPFRKGCRVTTTGLARYFHIDYRTFTSAEGIETFTTDLSLDALRGMGKALDDSLFTRKIEFDATAKPIRPGERATLAEASGPAVVQAMHLKIGEGDAKPLVLRVYVDDAESPCVEAPIMDFFGNGFERTNYARGLPIFADDPFFLCSFPMPFGKHIRVELENGGHAAIDACARLDLAPLASADDRPRFHARYREARTREGFPYEILRAEGEGHFCGVSMAMQGKGNVEFLEGDERVIVDGEAVPSWIGTGTEDFFQGGWYFKEGLFQRPLHGLTLKDEAHGRIAAHRFLTLDSIPFRRQVRVEIEHGGRNDYPGALYSSVAYWYQSEPHVAEGPLDAATLRVPRLSFAEPPGFVALAGRHRTEGFTGKSLRVRPWSAISDEWEGVDQVVFDADGEGQAVHFTLTVPFADRFDLRLFHTTAREFGSYRASIDGEDLGDAIDAYSPELLVNQRAGAWTVPLSAGAHDFAVRVVGRNARSSGFGAALDYATMRSAAPFLAEWSVAGPYPSANGEGLDVVQGPESAHLGDVAWKKVRAGADGYVDLAAILDGAENAVAYAAATIESPDDRTASLLLGSDDSAKVFLEGKEIFRHAIHRASAPDQDVVPLALRKGANRLLLKIENADGGFGFHARITDPTGDLRARPGA
ncbi:MAG: DUF2961 domain-containing protein [Planctomycetes bacterium]|nr:DUF2961 domain-containing protein [Planctomycetota bacterium]